jgi:hypothetical protein
MVHSNSFKLRWVAIPAVLIFVFLIWSTDRVTLKGERTIYTADCRNGTWEGNRCSGRLAPGPRFRYRALKARGEVLFWILGSQEPSSKLTGCTIEDGRNWTCPASADASKSLTLALSSGEPVRDPVWPTRPFHSTSKVGWWLLDLGVNSEQVID